MHKSAYEAMRKGFEKFFDPEVHKSVLDVGSRAVSGHTMTHRSIIEPHNLTYVGLDVVAGPNVDVVMKQAYRLPVASESADIIFCGQVFEHVPYFWVTFLEMARVLRKDGIILLTAPSRGHRHSPPTDCWRFYPDGMLALAKFSGLELLYAKTDFPKKVDDGSRLDYTTISEYRYWGDSIGVFKKTDAYRKWSIIPMRELMIRWANKRSNLKPGVQPQTNEYPEIGSSI
ncbi:Methyltransferase domain-containing protein [Xaviernesmea oryzae]|uniref:Methyltransferase domain-containing protein n=1 Tax=Xaviernesmea oryzae TaxID=464029 RepID=A0A1X7FSU3_9HYPH|nr:class I SAM-dependent methyltransferase [Xaviernesmea oryzae]SMF57869.1 Methyltransferase domain-containing protein [Xaviernesmea oryzae]